MEFENIRISFSEFDYKTRVSPKRSMRNGFLTVGRKNHILISRLISPNLAVKPTFKFLLLAENTKTET